MPVNNPPLATFKELVELADQLASKMTDFAVLLTEHENRLYRLENPKAK